MTLEEVADNHGLTPEGVDYALRQYQIVISEITHGLLSKLSYDAHDVLQCAQERWCDTCELKAQEATDTNSGKWISVNDAMPPERETIFAKFKGTDKWNPAMFATSSEDVRVVVKFEDGTRKVWHDSTIDGKWKCERENVYPKRTVIYWMPNPELSPKEEGTE